VEKNGLKNQSLSNNIIILMNIILFVVILIFVIGYICLDHRYKYRGTRQIHKRVDATPPFPIDIVYTWRGEQFSNDSRESNNNELKYSMRSIDAYAKWANKIYILHNYPKKMPSWVREDTDRVVLVDHSETFPNMDYLPNFNSNAIETTVTNIKGLSEHYVYLCDDMFLGRETAYTDFFTEDGKAIIDKRCALDQMVVKQGKPNVLGFRFPPTVNEFYPHVPLPQIKSVVKQFNQTYPDFIEWIRRTKKRIFGAEYNLNHPCQQIHYPICKFMLAKNMAVLKDNSGIDNAFFAMNDHLHNFVSCVLDDIYVVHPLFFCINDDEEDPDKRTIMKELMLDFFQLYYPNKPDFEK